MKESSERDVNSDVNKSSKPIARALVPLTSVFKEEHDIQCSIKGKGGMVQE